MRNSDNSVLIISPNSAFSEGIAEAFSGTQNTRVTTEASTIHALNGSAAKKAFKHDIVIFDADPQNTQELDAISALLSDHDSNTAFLALTDSEVSIVEARKLQNAGVNEVLPLSISSTDLNGVIENLLQTRKALQRNTYSAGSGQGAIIAVSQARGGIGSTTVAVNLALSLLGERKFLKKGGKKRVVLLDFDLQFGNANVYLDVEDNGGFLQLIESQEDPDESFLKGVLQTHSSGLDILCAPLPIAPLHSVRAGTISAMLDSLQRDYDYIVVDMPRAIVDWIEPVLHRASVLQIVTDTSVPCIRQAKRLIDFYREGNLGVTVDLVVNRDVKPMFKSSHLKEAETILDASFDHWIPDNQKLSRRAVDLGKPVCETQPKSDLGKAFGKIAVATRNTTNSTANANT